MQSVDLVIPNFQGEQLLDTCLDAVAAQTLQPARVIVVDDGSTDGSAAIVARHAGVEWLPLAENRGFPAAVNAGIEAASAQLIALLNTDAVPEPGWLEALVAALDGDPTISLGASRMLFPDGTVNAVGDSFDVRGRGGYNRGLHEPDGPRFDEPRIVFGACAGAAIYRRSLFADIGLFDEAFRLSWEDVDLDLRAVLAGHRCLYVPDAVVHHTQGSSSGASRLALERRNKAWLALRGLPAPLLVPFLALLPLREAYEARVAREGVRGWVERLQPFLREAPRAARWRRTVTRRLPLRALLPLLLSDSQPYVVGAASSSRQNERNASASLDGSREAGRTST
jgi:GT2 family glycosyltransferase